MFEAPPVSPAPTRYQNPLGVWRVRRDTSACLHCGTCAAVCPHGVFPVRGGKVLPPLDHLCRGAQCAGRDHYCVDNCPSRALSVSRNTVMEVLGDHRWTSDLILSTWRLAETGRPSDLPLESKVGASGGGFDRIEFARADTGRSLERVSTDLTLNRRGDGRPELTMPLPVYGGGMSFGSISVGAMLARVRAYAAWNSFCSTGEGGYPDQLRPYADHVITQVATGLFGVREETIQLAPIVEFKYAQGAKPGLGGHLLGDKVTPTVAKMREAVTGSALFSPFPFHSVYSVEDHKKHIDWIKQINPRALISVKVSTPTDVDMVAVGSYYAGAHIIHLDGSYGGTGAAPDIAKKNIAMPIEYAVVKVDRFLRAEGVRNDVTLMASGGIRTPHDAAKTIALGADGVVIGTADMIALECIRCHNCESGRGCPRGIATTDPDLSVQLDEEWGVRRMTNLLTAWRRELAEIVAGLRLDSTADLVGRTDLLRHLDYDNQPEKP